jgi:hypothetical protein
MSDAVSVNAASAAYQRPPWWIRLFFVIGGLAIWFGTQALLGARPPLPAESAATASVLLSENDGMFVATEPVNRFLNEHSGWANGLLIASSACIDVLGIFLLAWSILGPSIRPFLGLLILFGLRQICQGLTALPPPVGMIWRDPGFPSLLVTYGVANDLFFSGHTAIAVYGAVELARLGRRGLTLFAALLAAFLTITVLLLRAHYTMDVFAGCITALFVAGIAPQLAPACDRRLARLFAAKRRIDYSLSR